MKLKTFKKENPCLIQSEIQGHRKICISSLLTLCFMTIILFMCTACESKTDKALTGCWKSEVYECENLSAEVETELDINAYQLIKFEKKTFMLTTFYCTEYGVFAYASVQGKWSTVSEKGIRMDFNISSLKVKSDNEEIKSAIKKELLNDYGLLNDVLEFDSKEYNFAIRTLSGEEIGSTMILDEFEPITFSKILDGHYADEFIQVQLGQK